MKRLLFIVGFAVCLGMIPQSRTFAGGDEVIVIYNSRVPESKDVADYYALKRNVPTNQIFGFSLPTGLDMTRADFRDNFQKPLSKLLEARDLWHVRSQMVTPTNGQPGHIEWRVRDSKIRYAVLCYGVPVRILEDGSLKENLSADFRAEFRHNEASVDSELALLPLVELNLPLSGPVMNPLYATTNEMALHPTNGVLLVTRLDGPSAAIARGLVDKALEAETNGMWGRAYFDMRNIGDPGLKIGDEWIGGAAEICRRLGFETVVDNKEATFPASFPMSQIAFYCGWYAENVSGPFALPTVEFMPGAFAYHLHSFNAVDIRNPTNRWVGPFLDKGVTIAMGSVNEPYIPGTPNVAVFTADLIYSRYNFAEAAYASQAWLSWQTTVIGDPLYRPFEKSPEQMHAELALRKSRLIEWSYLRLVNLNQAALNKPVPALVALLEQLPALKQSAVLTEKLADLYAELGKPSSAIETYEHALMLDPSPQQKIRLRLVIAKKLLAENRNAEAVEDYQKLLDESPDYSGKAIVLEKLASLTHPASTNTTDNVTNAPAKP